MAYPAGVQTVTLRLGSSFDSAGTLASITGHVVPLFGAGADHLVWSATGQTYAKVRTNLAWDDTEKVAFATVPHPTQAGWKDQTQATFSGWSYQISAIVVYASGERQSFERIVTPQLGDTVIDVDLLPNGAAATPTVVAEWETARADALAALAASEVEQVTLTGDLAYELPASASPNRVHSVVFTQDATGGHTVTYGGQPVTVAGAAGAATLVEFWPGGRVVYPGAAGSGGGLDTEAVQDIVGAMVTGAGGTYDDAAGTITLPSGGGGGASTITADDTPAAPAEGESASYLVTSAVTWPAGLVWSTDPDGGVAPTITGTALVSMFTVGGVTRAILGATFPALPGADTTPPTVGTMAASAITTSGFTLTVSGASDAGGLHAQPYTFTTDGGTTWSAYQAANVLAVTGKAAGTGYSCNWRVRDAAGNASTGTAQTVTTTAAVTVLASDDFNRANSTTGLGVATTGQTWQQIGTGIVGIIDNRAYRATSNAFAVIDVGQVDMKVSHKVVAGGDYFSGPIARATADGQDFYWIDTGSGGGALARIQATIAGAQASPGGTDTFSTAPGDVLALSCKENGAGGTVVKLFINGVEKQSITDTRSNRPMGTRAGIRPFNNGNIRLDDFLVESA